VGLRSQCNCIMIIRTCSEKLVREAVRLGADEAHCVGNRLIIIWNRKEEPPCGLKCLVMQTMGEIIRKA